MKIVKSPASCATFCLDGLAFREEGAGHADYGSPSSDEIRINTIKKFIKAEFQRLNRYHNGGINNNIMQTEGTLCFSFGDFVQRGLGERFSDYIKENNLGKVYKTNKFKNYNTRREVRMYYWVLSEEFLKSCFKE